ncbi:MAG: MBG domain-containing protein [Ferruginibacter sp.]
MKKSLFTMLLMIITGFIYGQTTYYWVGGLTAATGINSGSNWNTAINGSGSSRPSSTGATDVLIFDGTNLGGATPATGPATILASSGITCAQVKFVNNVNVTMLRPTSGTSTITVAGELGEDFVVDAGSILLINSPSGSIRFTFQSTVDACRVSGTVSLITAQQMRFENGTAGSPGTFIFTSGSSFTTNITSSSSSYAFGSSSQSSEKWVVFEDGAHLYYEGGYSPNGSNSTFSPIDFKPGSFWHHRAAIGAGSFFNKKSFGNIIVENNSTLAADGPIYRINNLTVNTGCTFTTHTSAQTAIMGNLTVNGTFSADPASTNDVIFAGNTAQTISGTGTIGVPNLIVANNADVTMNSNLALTNDVTIYGKMNFTNRQVTGAVSFNANGINAPAVGAGNTVAGSYVITVHSGISTSASGQQISGAGIPPNTSIISVSVADDAIYISNPATATGTATALTVNTTASTLQTANVNGFDPALGTVITSGTATFGDNINYVINGVTAWPFGVTTGSSGNMIYAGSVAVNADITVNKGVTINNNLLVNAKITLRPADTVHILSGAAISGTFDAAKYIATDYTAGGIQSIVQVDGVTAATTIPVGTTAHYLPVTITPTGSSDFTIAAFTGITTNGMITGTPMAPFQKQRMVDAVWNVNRLVGTGNATVQINWPGVLEGSTYSTLTNAEIGLIQNNGSSWDLPIGTADNVTNIAIATISGFTPIGSGAIAQVNPFIFNAIAPKTYGDADFNGGATSLNTTQPIVYTSSNPLVATIVGGLIHITGTGTTTINASQATDGNYPAASVDQPLDVNKAALTITADNKSRFELVANPPLTITYTGFVLGETSAVLLTQPTISTTAVLASPPGMYPITVTGATAANYNITHVNGIMTVTPKQNQTITFNTIATKTYGNAAFSAGATSTNNTIPITYTSSNPAVATISGSTITITGAGTSTITANQAGNDGYFPATPVSRTLTVNKANLTIRTLDTVKTVGQPNPPFTTTFTGFVLGQTVANLLTPPVVSTIATTSTAPGYYPITLSGATSNNYNIIYVNGRLTILPLSGTGDKYINAWRNAAGNITVRVYSNEPVLGDIIVYDMAGRPVAKKNLFMPVGFISTDVPAQYLPSGNYVVIIRGNGVKLQKMIAFIK